MNNPATTEIVWDAIEKELFAVLGMVTDQAEARTVGIVYLVKDRKFYIGTGINTWKARHISANPRVSLTIPIAKRIPILPWIKIPQATITLHGSAEIIPAREAPDKLLREVFRHKADDHEFLQDTCLIKIQPQGDFLTYGIGVPMIKMRNPELARGRAPVKSA